MTGESGFDEVDRCIDEIAEELACGNPKSKSQNTIELRRLCGHHRTVPTSYKLEGVVKEGDRPQRISRVTELWKGRYNDEIVALKILRLPREDPHVQKTKSRFCKEVVLMRQLEHKNILPFYGVSMTVSEFCLVFPWYENGSIVDYLKKKPDTNRFNLLSDAASGLRFVHESRLVHGALRPSHVLVDNNGTARLATAGRSSIVAVPGTSIAGHMQSGGEIDNYRYSAPEIQWPEDHDTDEILITKESDVYGMAMIAYEVLTGNVPYSKCNDIVTLSKIQAGELPQRPPNGIADSIWELLEKCWSRDATERPSIAQVYDTFSKFPSLPQVMHAPEERSVVRGLPGRLKLQVQSIKIPLNNPKRRKFSVKFKYGNKDYKTSPTTKAVVGDEHTWSSPETWLIETNKQHHGQSVTFEVLRLRTFAFRKDKVCATGKFSLLNSVNKQIRVKLDAPNSTRPAVLEIFLMEAS